MERAAIAILADFTTHNIARRMVYEMNRHAPIDFFGSLLPAHVSLKQPFEFEEMGRLEAWFDSLARRMAPFTIELDRVYYSEWDGSGIIGLNVVETPILRALHNLINRELKDVVAHPSAAHDGETYAFHMTVELGPVGVDNPYKAFFDGLKDKRLALSFTAQHLALFYYSGELIRPGNFHTYRVMPFGS